MEQLPLWSKQLRYERLQRNWSQEHVAKEINVSPKTVGRWERGETRPRLEYCSFLCNLFGKTSEELGLLEEDVDITQEEQTHQLKNADKEEAFHNEASRMDRGEAPQAKQLYGRDKQCALVEQWIVQDRSRVVAVLGKGGIGKTALAIAVTEQIRSTFAYVFWRSLLNASSFETIIQKCILFLSENQRVDLPDAVDDQISLLIEYLRKHPCLLVLDNIETVLQEGNEVGHWQRGYESYGRLIKRIGETEHQSCLLLTSREKPKEVTHVEGTLSPVRSLQLSGLGYVEGKAIIQDTGLFGSGNAWRALIYLYSGIPLALKLVSGTIREVFGGDITRFLKEGMAVFGDVHDLLDQQFHRLSPPEKEVLFWLAIEREAISLDDLRANIVPSVAKGTLLRTLDSLRRRYMIETNDTSCFTLQPVIMEYVTDDLIERVCQEIDAEETKLLAEYALMKAHTTDYVRDSQVRLILAPLIRQLLDSIGKEDIEAKFKEILTTLRETSARRPDYAAGNVLNLLIQMGCDLRGYDFSRLIVRQAYLQGIALPEVNFAHADLGTSVFTDTFGSILCVAFSSYGDILVAGTATGEIRSWRISGLPLTTLRGHTNWIRSVAFSPDGRILASGSDDQTVRLWEVSSGQCLSTLRGHRNWIRSVAFSPDGKTLASGSEDKMVRLWEVSNGQCLSTLQAHTGEVYSVAFSPDGKTLASSSRDQTVRLWEVSSGQCLNTLQAHTGVVYSVTFSPDGKILASGNDDQTVRLWEVGSGQCLSTLQAHTNWVRSVAFSPDGKTLASGSDDQAVRLWEVGSGQCLSTLQAHADVVYSVAFSANGKILASGSRDQTVRLWEVSSGQCLSTLQGYMSMTYSVAFSPDGKTLASSNSDQTVHLWDVSSGQCLSTLQAHTGIVYSVAFSPDGKILASGSDDQTVHLWDVSSGQCLSTLQAHTGIVYSVAFSPDGKTLASGSDDQTVRLWEVSSGQCLSTLCHSHRVRSVAFSSDGKTLASGSGDQIVRLWEVSSGQCLNTLKGHSSSVYSVAFSPDGSILASGGGRDQTVRLWEISSGQCLNTLRGHTGAVDSVAFSSDGKTLASGSGDQMVCSWEISSGQCLNTLRGHTGAVRSVAFSPEGRTLASGSYDGTIHFWNWQAGTHLQTLRSERPYERMNITHVKGLTETQKSALKSLGAIEDKKQEIV